MPLFAATKEYIFSQIQTIRMPLEENSLPINKRHNHSKNKAKKWIMDGMLGQRNLVSKLNKPSPNGIWVRTFENKGTAHTAKIMELVQKGSS